MKRKIRINDILFTQIESRYHFLNIRKFNTRAYDNKLILDSFLPSKVAQSIARPNSNDYIATYSRGYAISDRTAMEMHTKQLHISELVAMLKYTKTDISKLLQAVKNKELSIILVGLGGTGSNFLYFLYRMAEWTGKQQIFHEIKKYDDDKYDVPNLLRIPFIPELENSDTEDGQAPMKVKSIPKKFSMLAHITRSYGEKLTEAMANGNLGQRKTQIIYGAPDMNTREFLSASPYTFIAGTHKDSEFSLVENPEIDQDLIIETYGKINLSMFFMNHLMMTIKFLEHIRDREEPIGAILDDNDNLVKDRMNVTIARENFDDMFATELRSGFKAGAKKLFIPRTEERLMDNIVLPGGN